MDNKNTTIAGIGAILIAVGSVLSAMFDGNPETTADFATAISAIIAGVGLILAKDAKETAPVETDTTTSTEPNA